MNSRMTPALRIQQGDLRARRRTRLADFARSQNNIPRTSHHGYQCQGMHGLWRHLQQHGYPVSPLSTIRDSPGGIPVRSLPTFPGKSDLLGLRAGSENGANNLETTASGHRSGSLAGTAATG